MTYPTLGLDVSFTTDPYAVPSWESIVDRALSLRLSTGRQCELDPFQPGTAAFDLDNHDRRFDPQYSGGPHYGHLLPNKRMRVQATHSGTTYDLYTGFVDAWPQVYDPPASATAPIKATDGLKRLARSKPAWDVYATEVRADSPRCWWRMGETDGNTFFDASGNGNDLFTGTARTSDLKADPLIKSANGASLLPTDGKFISYDKGAMIPSGTTWSIEFWFKADQDPLYPISADHPSGLGPQFMYPHGTTGTFFSVEITGPTDPSTGSLPYGYILYQWYTAGAPDGYALSSKSICDGRVHHVVLTRNVHDAKIYIDGADCTDMGTYQASGGANTSNAPGFILINDAYTAAEWRISPTVDEIALYPQELSASRVLAHYLAGTSPWSGDSTGTRVGRLLDLAGWPSSERTIDPGNMALGEAVWKVDTTALELVDQCERSEVGRAYVDHGNAGKFKFRQRVGPITDTRSTTSQATFSDDPSNHSAYRFDDFLGTFDATTTVNKVSVNWTSGTAVAYDQTSIDANGETSITVDTILASQTVALYVANGLLAKYKTPAVKVAAIVLNPCADQSLFPEVLQRRIGDRITVHYTPPTGSPFELDCIVEGIDHDIATRDKWMTTYYLSKADTLVYWTLGVGLLDGSGVLAF